MGSFLDSPEDIREGQKGASRETYCKKEELEKDKNQGVIIMSDEKIIDYTIDYTQPPYRLNGEQPHTPLPIPNNPLQQEFNISHNSIDSVRPMTPEERHELQLLEEMINQR
jgi:hypothetical protein